MSKKRWLVTMIVETSDPHPSERDIETDIISRAIADQDAGGMLFTLRRVEVEEERT